jgi:hypothetical protein
MGKTKNKAILEFVKYLTEVGERAIKRAYNSKEYKNRTYNLRDSYASAVYVNGVLYRDTIRYVGEEMSTIDQAINAVYSGRGHGETFPDRRGERHRFGDQVTIWGREEVDRFLADYKPERRGIELVVVAAMWYASILEKGTIGRKYRVISGAIDTLVQAKSEIGGKTQIYMLESFRDLSKYSSGSFTIQKQLLVV